MNRVLAASLAFAFPCIIAAQTPSVSSISINATQPWAKFSVDGQLYTGAATFTWPKGSKHSLEFSSQGTQATDPCWSGRRIQVSTDGGTVLAFGGWKDNNGLLIPATDPVQTVTADPSITSLTATVSVGYRMIVLFYDQQPVAGNPPSVTCVAQNPGAPGGAPPDLRTGIVYINGVPYWNSVVLYGIGTVNLNAYPYPGFVFDGWSINGSALDPYLSSFEIKGPVTIVPRFEPGKRVRFVTDPLGLQVLVDRAPVPTLPVVDGTIPCPQQYTRSPSPPPGINALCLGDFDFAPGSSHVISGVTPQMDLSGKNWVFDSWDRGGGQNTVYKTDFNTANPDTVTAKFVRGATVSFLTSPPGLKLKIDGRDNWPSYNFIWGIGTTHTVAAADQTGNNGRKYTFKGWSNSAGATQDVTVDPSVADSGMRLIASFDVQSRVVLQSVPTGLALQVDGAACNTPCSIDRNSGTQIHVTAPVSIPVGDGSRLDFTSWSDNSQADHAFTINSDTVTITANYQQMYRLAVSGDPANGATFRYDPVSNDMYYTANTPVMVNADAKPGFRFRRWAGDAEGSYPSAMAMMNGPSSMIARLDRVPYIAPAGVRNAAGTTPTNTVAPGSIMSVFGASLATGTIVGPTNPLSQTLGGLAVTVNDRILPLLFVSPDQINAQVPSDFADGDYPIKVSAPGQPDVSGTFTVARNSPGLFSRPVDSKPYALAAHEDGSPLTPDSPARQGEVVTIYGTGFGALERKTIDGFLLSGAPPNALVDSLDIQLGDLTPAAIWSGASTDYIGMMITKFQITPDMPSGTALELKVRVNGVESNTVLLPL